MRLATCDVRHWPRKQEESVAVYARILIRNTIHHDNHTTLSQSPQSPTTVSYAAQRHAQTNYSCTNIEASHPVDLDCSAEAKLED
ncbi:hypothetical protein IAQ61_004898 [Plenodomus lingam]|uniref:Predicted protein n=1 Tax=Leptosphaeria maculans (strain JN3 / isolate v23.1.3 / race Av1-4-5-6-7-8) TaxID=985895 RepID=E4ZWU5_LEPMJ|nr:predicted protein [Plenodomus lingam JN3]KAH9874268.1 hypothetical protein IAQ61_004898 [Plenodomus lingam]CBX96071.1 predicted protein [Plenodomus lingam JN3]